MENFLLLMNSFIDLWKIPSSMSTLLDMSFAVMCGVGLFYLLIPFLNEYPDSPPPGSKKNIQKVVKRAQSKGRKKTATVKACRKSQKNAQDTQNASRSMESPSQHPLLDSSPHSPWNSKEKLNHLSLPQLFSYLKVLEELIHQKFNQLLWGISSVFSESVVATAWVSRKSSSGDRKIVRFSDTLDSAQATPPATGPPELCQDQTLPNQHVRPSMADVTEVQKQGNLPTSILNQPPPSFQSRALRRTCSTTEIGIQASLSIENEPHQPDLNLQDIAGCNIQKRQPASGQATDLSRGTLPIKTIRSAAILPEHYQMAHHHEEPHQEEKAINKGKEQVNHVRFLPSKELLQLQGDFQPNKDQPKLNQPAQPSILNSESYKCSQMLGSVPTGVVLKKAIAKYGIPNTIKKEVSVRVKDLPCSSSSTPGKGLEPGKPPLRTDKLSTMNTTEDLSFLDAKTQMNLESNIMQLPGKHQILPCVSKAEYYSKAAMILEKLHHQDPGGTRVDTVSSTSLRSPLFEHSSTEVQETQRAPLPSASHGPSDQWLRNKSVEPHTFCLQAKTQQSRTILGTGRGILKRNNSPEMFKYTSWKMSEDVVSGHPSWSATTVGLKDSVPISVAEDINTLKLKEEPPHASRVNLGSGENPYGQAINFSLKDLESIEDRRSPGNLQTRTPQNSGDFYLKTKEYDKIDLRAKKQTQAWPVSHHPDASNIVHPANVSLPSQCSLSSFQNRSPNPKTFKGLGDLLMSMNTREFRVHKDKIEARSESVFHSHQERPSILKSGGINQGQSLGRVKSSILSSTQLKDTDKTESRSSLDIAGKRKALSKSSLTNITRNAAHHENLSTDYKEQRDSWKEERPPPVTEQTQEVVDRVNLIYSTAVELQSLMNALVQNLTNNVGDPPKLTIDPVTQLQDYKVDPLTFQLGGSSHSPDGLHDPDQTRPARRMSSGHASSKEHSHPCTYGETGDKLQPRVDTHRAYDQDQNKMKKELGFEELPIPSGNDHLGCYRRVEDEQKSGLAEQKAGDPDLIGMETGVRGFHRISIKEHTHSIKYTKIRYKQKPRVDQKAFDAHQHTKKGMGHGHLMNPKEYHPVKNRGNGGQEQSDVAPHGASDPAEIKTKSGREGSPHRSPKMHNRSHRYKETGGKPQPSVNDQRSGEQHRNSQKRRITYDNLLNPKGKNHPCWHRVTGDKQQLELADQRAYDSDQSTRSGMGSCPQRSPKGQRRSFRCREGETVLSSAISQRTCDQHPRSEKGKGFDHHPTPQRNCHPHSSKVVGDEQQSRLAHQRAYDANKKKSGVDSCRFTCPEGYNFLVRYGIIENKQQPGIVPRACDPHQNTKEGMGQAMSPKENHPVKETGTGGQDQLGVAAQGASNLR
ncbi:uncharacterized protein LOC127691875 [Apodemus sylvaticus]|uniref:uncharacterized protein LOC127691875 n=1 Tax=Apodemus sylvaticus TaxID=10129 RepID=UPI0022443380|nr:uncharacterized protein LOC127691875 [Apodemus sylvaticus]